MRQKYHEMTITGAAMPKAVRPTFGADFSRKGARLAKNFATLREKSAPNAKLGPAQLRYYSAVVFRF